ncbi:carboxypeptidase-like regulatory domain-containing protein [Fulvivirga maritima]|uniref:TonB-dependent receptor n=1 Tax=Fulvivirga maritima TaxID=2904247 RepID=UPI001F48C00B|nr:TonB-dependent receptor [Fulvivirga maritima]UII28002.1 carboxypeptidase-like regulatory domain-containing protein [Fulvivirga maritima]
MKKLGLILIFSLLLCTVYGQNKDCAADCSCSFDGVITDAQTGEPLAYASVQVEGTEKGTLTDENGHFVLEKLCAQEFDILVSYVGYKSVVHHHDLFHKHMNVQLAEDDMILESVVVEGDKQQSGLTTAAESKLSKKELDLVKNESLGDVLTNITGVSTMKAGANIVKPVIHGLYGNRILIINNGIRHEAQTWGSDHAPEIDVSQSENVTVVKGASAVKYGPDAMGGVVILDPPKMELLTGHLHGEAGVEAGSNGRSLSGNLLLQEGYKKWAWMAQISGRQQGDMKAPDYYLTNTGARNLSYMAGTRYHHKKLDLELSYSHVEQELGVLRGSVVGNLADLALAMESDEPAYTNDDFSYDINNPRQEVQHDVVTAKGEYNFSNSMLKFEYGFQANRRKEFDVRRSNNNELPSIDLELFTHTLDVEWLHPEINGWDGSIGGQWLYQDNNNVPGTNTVQFVPNYNNSRFGLYITESKPLDHFTLEVGVRYDYQQANVRGRGNDNSIYRQDLTYNSVTGLIGISKELGQYGHFRTSIGSAWRPSNVAELYSFGKHENEVEYGFWRWEIKSAGAVGTRDDVADQDSKPIDNETSIKWLATYNYKTSRHDLEITPYVNYIGNYIYTRPGGIISTVRGPFPYFVYDQTNALFYGLDASYIHHHNKTFSSQVRGAYLYVRDVSSDAYFVGIPLNKVGYKLNFEKSILGFDNVNASIEGNYIFKQYNAPKVISPTEIIEGEEAGTPVIENSNDRFDFAAAPDGYFLLDAQVNVTMGKLILGLRGKNLFNTSYRDYTNSMRYYADDPGINVLFSAKYKF